MVPATVLDVDVAVRLAVKTVRKGALMSEKPKRSEAEQLVHDREAMARLAPEARALAAKLAAGNEQTREQMSALASGEHACAAMKAMGELNASLFAVGDGLVAWMSAMAGIAELGAVAQTTGQVDALRARIESLPTVFRTEPDGGEISSGDAEPHLQS